MKFELPAVSAISALIVLIPLPWQLRTRNVCTISVILWLSACNILRAINTVIWMDNVSVKYEVWCDIVARVVISANIGVPASNVCICRRLAHASTPYYRAPTATEKCQRVRFEIGMCVVLPIILNGLHLIVEPCRFGIGERFGCSACFYPSIPGLFIFHIPTIVLSWTALVYSGVALRWLIHRRVQFQYASLPKQPAPASSHYLRLVALTITEMTFSTMMSLFLMMSTIQSGMNPWTSWEKVHKNWREIMVQPKDSMAEFEWATILVTWYFVPVASLTVFSYFGFDDRVFAEYKKILAWIKVHILRIGVGKIVPVLLCSGTATAGQTGSDANAIVISIGALDCAYPSGPSSSKQPAL